MSAAKFCGAVLWIFVRVGKVCASAFAGIVIITNKVGAANHLRTFAEVVDPSWSEVEVLVVDTSVHDGHRNALTCASKL